MRRQLVLALSLLTLGAAQVPNRATVEGVVLKTGTSEPVVNVDVALTISNSPTPSPLPTAGSNAIRVKTDSAGKFVFSDLAPGRYSFAATHDGFIRQRRSGPTSITLTAGQQIKDIRVSLTPTGTVSGRVIDENGEPRTLAVEILSEVFRDGTRGLVLEPRGSRTDDRGEYRAPNLAPGKYYLRAMPTEGQVAFAPSYYPGVPSPDEAIPVTVGAGADVAQINWQLLTKDLHVVKLKVTGILPGNSNLMFFPQPKGSGRIRMGGRLTTFEQVGDTWVSPPLAAGAYEIGIVARPPSPPLGTILPTRGQWVGVKFEIRDKDVDLGTVTMKPGYVLSGHVGGQVAPNLRVRLTPVGIGTLPIDVVSAPASVAADGTFTLTEVKEQRFKVELQSLPASSYIESATYKGQDVLNDGILVDGESGPLEISIAAGGSLQGVATNSKDEPIATARIVLIPVLDRRGPAVRFPSTTTDEAGAFTFSGLRPGDYGVLAVEDYVSTSDTYWEDPDFLKEYEIRAKKVTVTRGTSSSVAIRTITVSGK